MIVVARVYGQSMLPTLRPGDCIVALQIPCMQGHLSSLIWKWLTSKNAIVLVGRSSLAGTDLIVKRIGGSSGELKDWGNGLQHIPPGHVLLESDAVTHGLVDQRLLSNFPGLCPHQNILARAFIRVLPLNRLSLL